MPRGGRLSVAILASAAVVVAAPFVGDIRAAIQSAFPGSYRYIVLALVAAAVLAALAGAVLTIRDRRATRYGLIAGALAAAVAYARATSTGNPEVDAVEHFHFVEYGLLAFLYHRAWRDRQDVSAFALPVLAGLLVGTVDEWLQWFVPFRVGELRDVLLNGIALGCGLLFAAGLHPPSGLGTIPNPRSGRVLGGLAVVTGIAVAAFFHTVHLGHEVYLGPSARFMSRFSAASLAEASRDRAVRWASGPPVERRLSREDHYLSEGRWHIEERNEAVSAGRYETAWYEQQILDAFYLPVLAAFPGARWPDAQRAEIESRVAERAAFSSAAHPHPIYPWNPALFWVAAGSAIGATAWAARAGLPARVRAGQPA